jgi:hypothetical protein
MLQSKEQTMSMAMVGLKARIEAFFEEFPFLGRYIAVTMVGKNPKVSRVNLELLDDQGHTLGWVNHRFGPEHWDLTLGTKSFFVLGSNGEQLASVKPADVISAPRDKLWGIFTRDPIVTETEPESVFEAIQKLPHPNQIRYIVEIKDERSEWERRLRPDVPGFSVVVYKVPAGKPFSDWISRLKEIARYELSLEIKEIDRGETEKGCAPTRLR